MTIHPHLHRRLRALTVLEMLVSTTLLLLIVIGLTAMFVQTQRAFQAGVKQSAVADVGSTVADMIAADLSQISDARDQDITNLYFGWVPINYTLQYENNNNIAFRTNQVQEIFMLIAPTTNGRVLATPSATPSPAKRARVPSIVSRSKPPLRCSTTISSTISSPASSTRLSPPPPSTPSPPA